MQYKSQKFEKIGQLAYTCMVTRVESKKELCQLGRRSEQWEGREAPLPASIKKGTHFKALIKAILVTPLKSFERFFLHFKFPCRTVFELPW